MKFHCTEYRFWIVLGFKIIWSYNIYTEFVIENCIISFNIFRYNIYYFFIRVMIPRFLSFYFIFISHIYNICILSLPWSTSPALLCVGGVCVCHCSSSWSETPLLSRTAYHDIARHASANKNHMNLTAVSLWESNNNNNNNMQLINITTNPHPLHLLACDW